ncbi:PAS domain-containing protein [Robbsia sp. Bb-Pol-6]|uniref:PAS domain-containing protein n=1 Tax=Robbsia betulipollinis TaxID=2981849 RepID=A0ABT3ZRR0_9BURK|nr:CheR family methyltransferase [Robbsia betulipollinis]MCY0389239.1 PAS domain-containing protein [Robbsia betulipollinis]
MVDEDNGNPSSPEDDTYIKRSVLDFAVVGIGASSGGIPALVRFFENMPDSPGMAFVLVLHLSPAHESSIAEILRRVTKLPTRQVTEETAIEVNHVYVIPPAYTLLMNDGKLELRAGEIMKGPRTSIDIFFRTLALAHGEQAISVILSGNGADGSVGIQRIKECGGLAFAQTPDDAEYDSMPSCAIATGLIDFVMPVADMPAKLVALWQNAQAIALPGLWLKPGVGKKVEGVSPEESEHALRGVMAKLYARTGHDFTHYKRATILRRIERRLQVNGLRDTPAYLDFLSAYPEETAGLLKDLLISVTNFFRDRLAFEALERAVIDHLASPDRAEQPLRAWVAGCATGEEAYSLAVLLCDHIASPQQRDNIQIFATDIDEPALAFARGGLYPESIAVDIPPAWLRHFFSRENNGYRIKKIIRNKVLFSPHNILRDPPFSRLDLVCCRNLLIYLEREAQQAVLETFHFALKPGGFLFLGSSESADMAGTLFSVIDKKNRIYRANVVSRPRTYLSSKALADDGGKRPYKESVSPYPHRDAIPFGDAHQLLLSQYAPPSVLIDAAYNIVHITDRVDQFLRYVSGVPTLNLLTLVHPDLRLDLRTALYQAVKSGTSVDARRRGFSLRDGVVNVNITAKPVSIEDRKYILVLFDAVGSTIDTGMETGAGHSVVIAQLEEEVRNLKQQLQETIDDADFSSQELKASNEEFQSVNEELRSASEELETSKEELQSINEELITVNAELKTKVDESAKANEDLQNLIASSDIPTIFVDCELRIKRFTPRALNLFRLITSDIERPLRDITHDLQWETLVEDLHETLRSNRVVEREIESINKRFYIARISPYRTGADEVQGAVLTFVDVTRLRDAEARARATETRMQRVAQSLKDYAIVMLDPHGTLVTWNLGAEKIFGYTEAEAMGAHGSRIFRTESREEGTFEAEMHNALTQGRVEDERWYVDKDGTPVFCSGITVPLYTEAGTFEGFAKIARNMTQQQRLAHYRAKRLVREKEVRQASQQANHLKDEFLAIMSHELKHPLNLISVNAELASRLPGVQGYGLMERALGTISKAVKSQAKIIEDLLDLSRVNTGKLALNRAPFDIVPCIQSIVKAAGEAAAAKRITMTFDSSAPSLPVFADGVRIEQIIWNLVSNALKFTPVDGRIRLHATVEGSCARLDVADSGDGIDPAFLPLVFDLFKQANGRPQSMGGLGIGLALVKELASAHGGRVEARSAGIGQGTKFSVWIPLQDRQQQDPDPSRPMVPSLHGWHILLVDDMPESIEALGALLETDGAIVTVAPAAEAARQLRDGKAYDLLIADPGMSEMRGHPLGTTLKSLPSDRKLVTVALTIFGQPHDVQEALEAGFDTYLVKPVSLGEVQRVVAEFLSHR